MIDFYDEQLPYFELSNFYKTKTPLIYDGKQYATSEHRYQELKFLGPSATPADAAYAETVRYAKSPAQCKVLATQRVGGGYPWRTALNPIIRKSLDDGVKMRSDWEQVKVQQMEQVVLEKFRQDSHCRRVLLSTGDRLLSEHTSRDVFWGDGGESRHGENHLGKVLMRVRAILRAELGTVAPQNDEKQKKEEKGEEKGKEKEDLHGNKRKRAEKDQDENEQDGDKNGEQNEEKSWIAENDAKRNKKIVILLRVDFLK